MTDRIQTAKDPAPLRLGRRGDAAETRVERRVSGDPALRALHDGALDRMPRGAERAGDAAPGGVARALGDGGRPLDPGLRGEMEGAFGESFGDVRIHDGADADRAARAIDSAAFAAGDDIAFAGGAYRPDTAAGRGIIAHELAHVSETRAGIDGADMVRGVGPIEWLRRLFGGGNFSGAELLRFVRALSASESAANYTMESDNMARTVVGRVYGGDAPASAEGQEAEVQRIIVETVANLRVRAALIRHLLDGHSSDADQQAVLTVLRNATQMEREQLIRDFGEARLLDRFDGRLKDELTMMISIGFERGGARVEGTATSARGAMPVRWEMNTTIRNAPGLSSRIRGLAIEGFRNKATGWEDFRTIRRNAIIEGDNARDQVISDRAPHPKNAGGVANMTFWVVPADAQNRGAYAFSTRTPVADTVYEPISSAENQTVEATLEVDLGAATIGEVSSGRTRTEGAEVAGGVDVTDVNRVANGASARRRVERRHDDVRTESDTFELSLGASGESVRGFEEEENWQRSVTQTREQMRRIERSAGRSTTSTTQTEISLSSEISSEVASTLRAQLGLTGEGTVGLDGIGTGVLGTVLQRLPAPQARALGAILSMVDSASAGLTLGLSGEAGGSTTMTVGGRLSGRAARLWTEAQTRSFNLTDVSGTTDSTAEGASAGGRSARSGEERRGVSSGARRGGERGRSSSDGVTVGGEEERRRDVTTGRDVRRHQSFARRSEAAASVEVRRNMLVPVVERSRLTFRVVRNSWGESTPHAAPPATATGAAPAREREGR